MLRIGYHASYEQFAPSRLLALVKRAAAAGFHEAKSSDHFHPWSDRQGQSGFAWSWLGAALESTNITIGTISAPGYRYHPAILAQAAATLGEMYPGRFWLALGSGEAINEGITGEYWPDKRERNARLLECVEVVRALFAGETVTNRGRVTTVEAKLYTRPEKPVPLLGAAMSEPTARLAGSWADGILRSTRQKAVRPLMEAFQEGGGEGKPIHVQMAVSWANTKAEAARSALDQWGAASLGGEVAWDLRRQVDFDQAARFAREEDLPQALLITDRTAEIVERAEELASIGAAVIQLHQVGTNQEEFIDEMAPSLARVTETLGREQRPFAGPQEGGVR